MGQPEVIAVVMMTMTVPIAIPPGPETTLLETGLD